MDVMRGTQWHLMILLNTVCFCFTSAKPENVSETGSYCVSLATLKFTKICLPLPNQILELGVRASALGQQSQFIIGICNSLVSLQKGSSGLISIFPPGFRQMKVLLVSYAKQPWIAVATQIQNNHPLFILLFLQGLGLNLGTTIPLSYRVTTTPECHFLNI